MSYCPDDHDIAAVISAPTVIVTKPAAPLTLILPSSVVPDIRTVEEEDVALT
jgi:hypothetical protein